MWQPYCGWPRCREEALTEDEARFTVVLFTRRFRVPQLCWQHTLVAIPWLLFLFDDLRGGTARAFVLDKEDVMTNTSKGSSGAEKGSKHGDAPGQGKVATTGGGSEGKGSKQGSGPGNASNNR